MFRRRVFVNFQYWKYALKLGTPLIVHSLSMILLMQIGKIFINNLCGDSETGIYSVGATISAVLGIVMGSVDNAWAPWFYRGLNEGKQKELISGNNKLVMAFSAVCCLFLLISPEMVKLLSTKDYYDGLYSLVPLVVATYINFMYLFAVNQEYFYKKTKTIAIGTIVATLCGIVLNYLLIPIWGYLVAAYVNCISNMILFAIHTIIVKIWKKPDVVSMRVLFGFLFATSLIGASTITLRNHLLLRFLVMIIILIPLVKYGHTLYKNRVHY